MGSGKAVFQKQKLGAEPVFICFHTAIVWLFISCRVFLHFEMDSKIRVGFEGNSFVIHKMHFALLCLFLRLG